MGEPLKDKRYCRINHGCNPKEPTPDCYIYFSEKDIKSAVEWLKEKKLGEKLKPFDFEGKEMIVFYKEEFDEAFEDVISLRKE